MGGCVYGAVAFMGGYVYGRLRPWEVAFMETCRGDSRIDRRAVLSQNLSACAARKISNLLLCKHKQILIFPHNGIIAQMFGFVKTYRKNIPLNISLAPLDKRPRRGYNHGRKITP